MWHLLSMPWKIFRIMAVVKGIPNQYFRTGQFVKSVQMKDFKGTVA
jgi:hypothetical protein